MAAHSGETAGKTDHVFCDNCMNKVRITQGHKIPACPKCGNDTFEERLFDPVLLASADS